MKLSFVKKTIGLSAALLLAGQANAALITDWNWTLDSGWTSSTPPLGGDSALNVIGSDPVTGIAGGFATISWGTPASSPSSLTVVNPNLDSTNASADMFELVEVAPGVYSDTVNGTLFQHDNNPIFAPFAVAMGLTDLFTITASGAAAPSAGTNPTFDWIFSETPNNDATCWADASATPGDFEYETGNPCPDVMLLSNPAPLQFTFVEDGYFYTVAVGAFGLGPLPDAACGAVSGGAPGCFGLITQENEVNPFQFVINLTARAVPEPSILALMGLGLLGLGYRRRQKK